MAKTYGWVGKGMVIPELPSTATPKGSYKLCAKKNPYSGAVEYYWALDVAPALPYFSPCQDIEFNIDYSAKYGLIGSMVNVLFQTEYFGDVACPCRVVRTAFNSPPVEAYMNARYLNMDNCKQGVISTTGEINGGYAIETIGTDVVGLIVMAF